MPLPDGRETNWEIFRPFVRNIVVVAMLVFGLWGLITTLQSGERWAVFLNGIATGVIGTLLYVVYQARTRLIREFRKPKWGHEADEEANSRNDGFR